MTILIKSASEDTDTTNWPEQYVKLYITNHAARNSYNHCKTQKRIETQGFWKYQLLINADVLLNKTGNLPKQLKICLGTRVMLTTCHAYNQC